ncbi:hypothetical protein NKH77_53895 [Streptomyces sp. M19]
MVSVDSVVARPVSTGQLAALRGAASRTRCSVWTGRLAAPAAAPPGGRWAVLGQTPSTCPPSGPNATRTWRADRRRRRGAPVPDVVLVPAAAPRRSPRSARAWSRTGRSAC